MPVAALDAGQSPAGTGLDRTPAGGRATKGGEIPAVVTVVTGRDSGYACGRARCRAKSRRYWAWSNACRWPGHQRGRDSGCGNRERFRLCLWLRSMPGKVPQILGLVERLPVAGPTKGGEIPAMPVAGPSRWGVGLCRYGAGLPPTKQAQRVSGGLAAT